MSWQLAYAVFGAPLLLVVFGAATVWITKVLERRERRLYDDHGWPRVQDGSPRR